MSAKSDRICYEIGQRIAAIRKEKKLSQNDVATAFDVTVDYIRQVETRGPNFTIETLLRFCDYLKADLADVIPPARTRPRKLRAS